jgi:hypothetical protein
VDQESDSDQGLTGALLEEPLEVVAALAALALHTGDHRHLPDVLHDAPGGRGQLLAGGPARAKRVGELVALDAGSRNAMAPNVSHATLVVIVIYLSYLISSM